ncbi:MAG TPA: YkgJ family cysteine cluster protein [Magnetospirillum sp.]|nr:YkgJ family cysteine cluster protein [Magnetospirillum sp.]
MLAASEDFLIEAARGELSRCWPKPTVAALCAALDAVFRLADATWNARRSNLRYMLEAPASACKAGCGWCCHQQVGVSTPEAIRIAAHLRTLPEDEGAAIGARVREVAKRTQGMTTGQRAASKLACPFLGADGACMIYAVRPLRCRGLHSIDVDFCIACHEDLDAMRRRLEAGELKPVFLETPERIYDSALAGVLKALSKGAPKAVVSLELSAAVAALLEQPKLAERWLAGARPDKALHLVPGKPG